MAIPRTRFAFTAPTPDASMLLIITLCHVMPAPAFALLPLTPTLFRSLSVTAAYAIS